MTAQEYLSQNKESINQECKAITNQGSKAIITVKENDQTYIHKVSTVDEFTKAMPDNKFFKTMRDGITNAVKHRAIPIVIFAGQKAQLISLPDDFKQEK